VCGCRQLWPRQAEGMWNVERRLYGEEIDVLQVVLCDGACWQWC